MIIFLLLVIIALLINISLKLPPRDYSKEVVEKALRRDGFKYSDD